MAKKDIKLIALDLDGTLLDSDGTMPQCRAEALRKAAGEGVFVTLATGRMYQSAAAFAYSVPINAPLVVYNGAMVRCARNGGTLMHTPISGALARSVMIFLKERGFYVQAYVNDRLLVERASDPRAVYYSKKSGVEAVEVGEALYKLDEPSTKLLSIDEPGHMSSIRTLLDGAFTDQVELAGSVSRYLEISAKGVSKAVALHRVARHIGIGMNQVMAVGDGDNDAQMLAECGFGVAVHGSSLAAQNAANYISPPNEDPIVWAVAQIIS